MVTELVAGFTIPPQRVYQAQRYRCSSTGALKDSIKAAMCPFLVLEVQRDSLVRDTLAQMRLKRRDLKKPLKIKYVGGGEQVNDASIISPPISRG